MLWAVVVWLVERACMLQFLKYSCWNLPLRYLCYSIVLCQVTMPKAFNISCIPCALPCFQCSKHSAASQMYQVLNYVTYFSQMFSHILIGPSVSPYLLCAKCPSHLPCTYANHCTNFAQIAVTTVLLSALMCQVLHDGAWTFVCS